MTDSDDLSPSEHWHVYCQQFFDEWEDAPPTLLDTEVIAKLRMLPAQTAAAMLAHVKTRAADDGNLEIRSAHQDFMFLPESYESLLLLALAKMCDGELGAMIRDHFQCEFMVTWIKFLSTWPEPRPDAVELEPDNPTDRLLSTMWHRDGGLSPFLHVIVYLHDFLEHRGTTEFLDLDTSRRVIEAGHTHLDAEGDLLLRQIEFEKTMETIGIPIRPTSFEPVAGEGVVFDAANCFHREVLPTAVPRYVMLLAMAPSPLPWRDSYGLRPAIQSRRGTVGWSDEFMKVLFGETKRRQMVPKNDRWQNLMTSASASSAE